jgi:hypothetical protein
LKAPANDNPLVELPPFLRIPVELRKLIYAYLVPNVAISPWLIQISGGLLRKDGICGASVLRINRQIYHEVYADWYGSTIYGVDSLWDGTEFLNYKIPHAGLLPSTLLSVRSLHLFIRLKHTVSHRLPDSVPNQYDSLAALGAFLSSSKCSLQRLHLDLMVGLHFYDLKRTGPETLRDALAWNLLPFRVLRGLSEVHTSMEISSNVFKWRPEAEAKAKKAEFISMCRLEYCDDMEKEMLMPVLSTH